MKKFKISKSFTLHLFNPLPLHPPMLKNYILTSLRNFRRHQLYATINVLGLTVGLSCVLLIITYVYYELQYDQFHVQKERIVRASLEYGEGGIVAKAAVSPTAVLPVFQRAFPEVVGGVRIFETSRLVQQQDKSFQEEHFFYADSTFFSVFSFPLLQGDSSTALTAPQSVVLTASVAEKYYGEQWANQGVVGKTLLIGTDRTPFTVTGVMANPPVYSHFHPRLIASTISLDWFQEEMWWSANYYTYLLLNEPEAIHTLEAKIPALLKRELPDDFGEGNYVQYNLLPLSDIHLQSDMSSELEPGGDYRYVYIFSAVALLILLVACINYVNLTTARATHRAREVGMRKVLGAYRSQLFGQFISEAALITVLSMLASLVLAHLLLPYFQQLAQRDFTLDYLGQPVAIACIVGIGILVSLLAGGYPAVVLSSFRPVQVLKGKVRASGAEGKLRQGLVVFQFVISTFLIVSTFIIYQQLNFIQQQKLGYDKNQLIALPMDDKVRDQYEALKTELKKQNQVEEVSAAYETPTNIQGGYTLSLAGTSDEFSMATTGLPVSEDFLSTAGLELVAGYDFNPTDLAAIEADSFHLRTFGFMINETAARALGFSPEEAMQQDITMTGRKSVLRGVVKDFHFGSLHKKIEPLVIFFDPWQSRTILVRTAAHSNASATLAAMRNAWDKVIRHRPFEATFLNDEFNALYTNEQQAGQLFNVFALIAVFIACLGLFGLTAFTTVQRAKEIGIRKVLGASVLSIVVLLSRDITKLVLVALLLAIPLSYFLMDRWLESFAYRIGVPVTGLVVAGIIALLIAWLTVSYQAIRAALSNPVDALKSE